MLDTIKQFTKSQKLAYVKLNNGNDIFLNGVAGTGKTYFLNNLQKITGKKVHLTASTGSASLQLNNGKTISSFLGLGKYDAQTATFRCRAGRLDNSIIVIDEIGMIGQSQWKYILKGIAKNSKNPRSVQIIISGDPKQMPPIYWDKPLNGELKSFQKLELKEITRQQDAEFINHLMDIRNNGIEKHLEYLIENSGNPEKLGVTLVADRKTMDEMNAKVEQGEIIYTCDLTEHSKDADRPYEFLKVWQGMKILITHNYFKRGYVNGDTGIVVGWYDDYDDENDWSDYSYSGLEVKLDRTGETVIVQSISNEYNYEVEVEQTDLNGISHTITETKTEYYNYMPILPAFYLSVRRAQGSTLEYGSIHKSILYADIPTQYTAFSRFKSINNINLEDFKTKNEMTPDFKFTEKESITEKEVTDLIEKLEVSNTLKKILINNIPICKPHRIYDLCLVLQNEPQFPPSLLKTILTKDLETFQYQYIYKNLVTYWHGIKKTIEK